ncbi:hypothetical protein [Halocatena salina]|uniref:Uncharacterized protein n=1 Tax=Halocatena salina TaxID=2934340 RepID=A0A8U0A7W9_9EURY|nr:hypothetical protein [Halocatena salina]UPM45084.1 hypothetical protein MW046_17130 [Halocatena salina]
MSDSEPEDEFESQLSNVGSRTKEKLSEAERRKAEKLGVSPATTTSDETTETNEQKPATGPTSQAGAVDHHEYPNPDKKQGSLSDVYEKTNVFWSPPVKAAMNELWTDIDYEWKKSHDSEIEKHWDFYLACFRVLLENEDLIREELGMDTEK